ncbi:MAG: acetate kinase [Bacteroidales bacterium]|nr:acetate kinase [Bacteroidales bacterium]
MIILVINCGSSSIKYQVLDMKSNEEHKLLVKGLVERIGDNNACIGHTKAGADKYVVEKPIKNHTEGIQSVLELLTDKTHGVVENLAQIDAVGHRVAHGGDYFFASVKIDADVVAKIEKCCELAPLHNPANLLGIKAVSELMPEKPQVAVFDTSFHQTMPDYAYMYAIPYEYYEKYRVRRYGFHGTSHKFVAEKACRLFGVELNNSRIITCHLGNGSSITAIKNGKSVDTSMGFTPVEGVPMGTRSGNVDAGVVAFLQSKENKNADGISDILNKKSGLLGISGVSSDNRDVISGMNEGNDRCRLAHQKLGYEIKKYIGAYAAVLNGVDMIVFTGGIGENSAETRLEICNQLQYLGIDFNPEANKVRGKDIELTNPGSKVKVVAVTTNEELVIAIDTARLAK